MKVYGVPVPQADVVVLPLPPEKVKSRGHPYKLIWVCPEHPDRTPTGSSNIRTHIRKMHPGSQLEPVKLADISVKISETPPPPPPPVQVKTSEEVLQLNNYQRGKYYKSLDPAVSKKLKSETSSIGKKRMWAKRTPEERERLKKHLDEIRPTAADASNENKQETPQPPPPPPIDSNEDKEAGGSPISS